MSGQSRDGISCTTSVGEIIAILATRGCPNLTEHINWDECGNLPIAGGGFCDVYRGKLYKGTNIAIRSLRIFDSPGDDNQTAVLKNAAKELYHWSKLRHPNVLPLMGLAMYRGQISMVSEWMTNGNLSRYLIHHPEADRLALCRDICAGLDYIHSEGMVHGDVKAANVLVSPEGVAIIADFGNARLKELTVQFTGTTACATSLRWAAPELLMGERCKPSIHSDIYAFGMTALEALTGEIPFKDLSDMQLTFRLLGGTAKPSRLANGIGNDTWMIFESCWAREPEARPPLATIVQRLSGRILQQRQHLGQDSLGDVDEALNNNNSRHQLMAGPVRVGGHTSPICDDPVIEEISGEDSVLAAEAVIHTRSGPSPGPQTSLLRMLVLFPFFRSLPPIVAEAGGRVSMYFF